MLFVLKNERMWRDSIVTAVKTMDVWTLLNYVDWARTLWTETVTLLGLFCPGWKKCEGLMWPECAWAIHLLLERHFQSSSSRGTWESVFKVVCVCVCVWSCHTSVRHVLEVFLFWGTGCVDEPSTVLVNIYNLVFPSCHFFMLLTDVIIQFFGTFFCTRGDTKLIKAWCQAFTC